MSAQASFRIMKELKEFQDRPDTNLFVHYDEQNVMRLNALLIGPEDTPYEYGLFEFLLVFPNDYPSKAPHVTSLTTNSGRTRFNPNIYASGKVCLSILGTWRGEPGEEWRSSQGFQSVLISILSLMNQDPYKNEPGYEDYDKHSTPSPPTPVSTPPITNTVTSTTLPGLPQLHPPHHPPTRRSLSSNVDAKNYIRKIRHETIRISVIERLEGYLKIGVEETTPTPVVPCAKDQCEDEDEDEDQQTRSGTPVEPEVGMWVDHCKRLFLWYYDIYMEIIDRETKLIQNRLEFPQMPFETHGNAMRGRFNYPTLLSRLQKIRQVIDEETAQWAEQGPMMKEKNGRVVSNLTSQFYQCQKWFGENPGGVTLDLEMENDNPFVWRMVYFGRPLTNWDGGLFTLRLIFPPTFPVEYPRIRFLTPFYHANVTPDGIPYYRVARPESCQAHIEALIDLFVKDMNPDPSCVLNRKCADLCWRRGEDGRKEFNRILRGVISRSIEFE